MNDPASIHRFDAEVALIRDLVHRPPWLRPGRPADDPIDQGFRAPYRRWVPPRTASDTAAPTPEMIRLLWASRRIATLAGWRDDETDRAVERAAVVLHLVSLTADDVPRGRSPETARAERSLGAALAAAGVVDKRFVALMHTPFPGRIAALGRALRRLRSAGLVYRPASAPGRDDRHSAWHSLGHSTRDDLAALVLFLFHPDADPAVARWAGAFFRASAPDAPDSSTPAASEDA